MIETAYYIDTPVAHHLECLTPDKVKGSELAARVEEIIQKVAARADKAGLPYPAKIKVYLIDEDEINGSASIVEVENRHGDVTGYMPVLSLTTGAAQCNPDTLEALIAHEIAHFIDMSQHALARGRSKDLQDEASIRAVQRIKSVSEAAERRAIRLSFPLMDDPWSFLQLHIADAKKTLKEPSVVIEDGKEHLNHNILIDKQNIISSSEERFFNHVQRLFGAQAEPIHPGLLSILHETKKHCEREGLPIREDLIQEAHDIAREVSQITVQSEYEKARNSYSR